MKKILITTLAALAAVTSCMKDEVKDVNRGTEIGFQTSVQTKGMEARAWTLETIYVTALEQDGTPYFSEAGFAKTGNSSDGYFNTSPAYYWPGDGRAFDFYAYSPSEDKLGGGNVEITVSNKKLTGFVTQQNIFDQVDFITAVATDITESEGSVGLTFDHRLTRVQVSAWSGSTTYEYIVKGVKIADVGSKGDFDFDTGEWDVSGYESLDDFKKTFSLELPEAITLNNSSQSLMGKIDYKDGTQSNYAFFIPQSLVSWNPENPSAGGSYISVKVQINKKNDDGTKTRVYPESSVGEYDWVSVPMPGNTVWNQAESYHYSLNFGTGAGYDENGETILGEAIKMTMDVQEWIDSENSSLKNIEMIGTWTATRYYENILEDVWNSETSAYEVKEFIEDETTDPDALSANIDGFNKIVIKDGTKLVTTRGGVSTETDYILDEDKYILIDTYANKDGEGNIIGYNVRPQIINITPASADPYQLGSAEIHVLQQDSGTPETGNYRKRVQVIEYVIEPLGSN